ncbi:hypothetical protein G4Y79_01485 [Phototrophicus methaneseepsis]|uniref:Uncharacterized protein n=1 Tax=Phototrophicus methaneseepsis TaxID=2710758 RepID=A0A7S8E9X6_9CHLR|nr:hypothetical protein [Phototrophicus methaneseepsis]QPC83076.1 hypothetical protein G4Y79_01485 [Phototrophicus methaneseepsis]
MNDLLQTYTFLNQAMQSDSLLCLAQAVCWLDPLWRGYDEDFYHDPDGILSAALVVTRQLFPDLYVDAIDKLRQGATYATVDQLICEGISNTGIPLDNLEYLPYGIPLPAYGVELNDADFYTTHPEVIPILACFGISPEANPYHMTIPDCVYTAAEIIATDLAKRPEEQYQQVAWGLLWLTSATNNSICDWDAELMMEVEPLAWETNDLAFARVMIEEADEIMGDVLTGLYWLTSEPAVMQAMQDNIHRIYKAIQKKGKNNDAPNIRLKWVDLAICPE